MWLQWNVEWRIMGFNAVDTISQFYGFMGGGVKVASVCHVEWRMTVFNAVHVDAIRPFNGFIGGGGGEEG